MKEEKDRKKTRSKNGWHIVEIVLKGVVHSKLWEMEALGNKNKNGWSWCLDETRRDAVKWMKGIKRKRF